MKYKGFVLDQFQEDAINAIENNKSVVVSAPTGSGKTLIADYIINKDIKKKKVIYTAPIKALSNQKYKEFSEEYGEENIGLLTGDIVKNPEAPVLIMTTEVYRNMALTNDESLKNINYVIFDEIHYINDIERGYVWEESIIFSRKNVRFLCLSATIPNAEEFAAWIRAIKKHEVSVIMYNKRHVPLFRFFYDSELGVTTLEKIRASEGIPEYRTIRGRRKIVRRRVKAPSHIELIQEIRDKLPCFFFTFSRKGCQDNALELYKKKIFELNPEITKVIRKKLEGVSPEVNNLKSTKLLRQVLPYGIGFHHAGLIPVMKELVEELFGQGLIKVLYTTETFAVGINMPAKTVCFYSLRKFDGINFRFLNSKEYFQIAGRAGRRGIDKEGYAYAMMDRRDFDFSYLKKITSRDVDPIKSQFRLSINTVLNLVKRHEQKEIDEILRKNFYTYQKYGVGYDKVKKNSIFFTYEKILKRLVRMGYVVDGKLSSKGEFSSKIYADEILMGEIFATDFIDNLNEFQILMLLACLVYEGREKVKFTKRFHSEFLMSLRKKVKKSDFLRKEKRFDNLNALTALIDPIYHGKSMFDVLGNCNLLEGDVIRLFRQILDRIGQVRDGTHDERLIALLKNCKDIVEYSMKDIDVI